MPETDDRWRIKEFAARVGVQEPTLRAWERRYDLLRPERSGGGYRLYSTADERRVRSMQAHMQRGISAAQAAALAVSESAHPVVVPDRPGDLVESLLDATRTYDATRLDTLLDAAFGSGLLPGLRDVVLPTLVEVGAGWARDEIGVGQEHFASHLIERRLLGMAKGWESGRGRLGLLACVPGERHTLGLVCSGLLLADRGWRIAYLGADTPIDQIAAMSDSLRPDVVLLCSLAPQRLSDDADAIAGLATRHHTILGGRGVTAEVARRLGVHAAPGDPAVTALALADSPRAAPSTPTAAT